jgi:hypothetical protein
MKIEQLDFTAHVLGQKATSRLKKPPSHTDNKVGDKQFSVGDIRLEN